MLSRVATVATFLLVASSSRVDESTWGPLDSVHALDSVVNAVNNIVKNPHLSAENLKKAKHVAEDIKGDIEAVENGKLTKVQALEKVGAAMKELTSFQEDLKKQAATLVASKQEDKISSLRKQLAEKKALLAKDEDMMKLVKLKMELAEKKLMLQKLMNQKSAAESGRKDSQDEAAMMSAMVKNLTAMAKGFAGSKKSSAVQELPAPLKAALASVQAREHEVSDALAKMASQEKAAEASLDVALRERFPAQDKGDAIAKGQSMLKRLKAEEHRKFAKTSALEQIELKELKDAEASIEKRDVAGLKTVLSKMQHDSLALQAKSGNFLH